MIPLLLIVLIVVNVGGVVLLYSLRRKTGGLYWEVRGLKSPPLTLSNHRTQEEARAYLLHLLKWPPGALPPLGGWAASADILILLAEWILDRKPALVVELGSGVSSLVIGRCLQLNGRGQFLSYDHDAAFLAITARRMRLAELPYIGSHIPLGADSWYSLPGNGEPLDVLLPGGVSENTRGIDLLFIDGPPMAHGEEVRAGASRLFRHLTPGALVLLDDAARPGERRVAQQWAAEFPELKQTFLATEKGALLLTKK